MSGINNDVDVTITTERIGFTGESVVVESDAVRMTGIKFASAQHQFHLADKMRECFFQLQTFGVTKLPVILARSAR